jgi:putative ABC transport system substrate-binding protein
LVGLRPDVIVAGAAPAPEAARRAMSTIPIVMINHSDPVGSGLVTSLANPGGNVTGMSLNTLALRGKQLQLLKEAVPSLTSVAVLVNPTVAFDAIHLREVEAAARALKITPHAVEARTPSDFEAAFSAATKRRVGALVVVGGSMIFAHREALAELASRNRLPAIYGVREHVDVGGLMSFGVDIRDSARRAAAYVDKILKGAKAADLPVEQPTRFYLTVNLRTAKALGLTIPQSLLLRADEVIE